MSISIKIFFFYIPYDVSIAESFKLSCYRCCHHYVSFVFIFEIHDISFVSNNLSFRWRTLSHSAAWNRYRDIRVHRRSWIGLNTVHKLFGKYYINQIVKRQYSCYLYSVCIGTFLNVKYCQILIW